MSKKKNPIPAPSNVKMGPLEAVEGLKMVLSALQENNKTTEQERTKRKYIEAQKEIEITRIKEQANFLKNSMNNSFSERRENFDKLFEVIDKSLDTNNINALNVALSTVIKIAEQSPISQEINNLLNDYQNPDVDEIEI